MGSLLHTGDEGAIETMKTHAFAKSQKFKREKSAGKVITTVFWDKKGVPLIAEFGWDVLDHPPYSPDIDLSDFHMFPALKKHLGEMKFANDEEVHEAVISFLREAAET